MNILYISTRVPFPVTSGDRLIIYNRLIRIHKKHKVSLIVLYQNDDDLIGLEHLESFCENIWTFKLTKFDGLINIVKNYFLCQDPAQVMYYNSSSIKRQVSLIIKNQEFDLINTYLIRTIPYIEKVNIPVVLDAIDSMQLNFLKRLNNSKGFFRRFFYQYEYDRLVKFESKIPNNVKRVLFVSERDSSLVPIKSNAIPLGVNTEIFKPSNTLKKNIIFSGNMSYEPNIQAVMWFVENCLNKILESVKGAVFIVAGKDPTSQIKKMASSNVVVTGYVDSIAELISESSVSVVPMVSGSGMQNKLLEAMSCAVPVVATSYGLGDIKAQHMEDILIADDSEKFCENTC